jgi:geranylgeranyl reductase family protein
VERFDTIVVGAGPAGATTAYRLASAGASVLLLDRARFPRDKPCGGGLTRRAVRLLPHPIDPVVEHEADRLEIRLRYGSAFERANSDPLVLLTQRRRLDAYLAEQAAAVGADFRDGVRIEAIAATTDGIDMSVNGARIHGRTVIGADGANGVTARAFGLAQDIRYAVAFEGNIGYGAADPERFAGRLVCELGVVPGGYGWVFPKGDHVNVGIGGWLSEGPRLRGLLRELCEAHDLPFDRVEALRGHRLPMRTPSTRLAAGRAALVGDAAGLVDPLSGDGMYEAFLSSKLVAAGVLEVLAGRAVSLDPYHEQLTRSLAGLASASWSLKMALDRFPRLSFALIRAPFVWPVVVSVLRGDLAHPGEARGPARTPLRILRVLSRGAGGQFRVAA